MQNNTEELPLLRYADTRKCRDCLVMKPIEQFPTKSYPERGKTYRIRTCKDCRAAEESWRWRNKLTPEQKQTKLRKKREVYAAQKRDIEARAGEDGR